MDYKNSVMLYSGKVRDVYSLGDELLLMKATDRVSSFDKIIGEIDGKGILLNKMSNFWFNMTRHITDNHLLSTDESLAFVKKCTPFKIEFIVRGYITGNTSTSLWTHYNNGARIYCGIEFPDGLKKNSKLDKPVITPTTKDTTDVPVSMEEIISHNYMTRKECKYLYDISLKLFRFGQKIADRAGFILVDTKYEFGKDKDGNIILIDELHTCDSSRYWIKETYEKRMSKGEEPDKLDKDCVRDWVKSVCDPYKDKIPEIPNQIVDKAYKNYKLFYDKLEEIDLKDILNEKIVVILSGSEKDCEHVMKIRNYLNLIKNIGSIDEYVLSAHKNTHDLLSLIKRYDSHYKNIIWITVAGRSNALSGVVAANSKGVVIACPPFKDNLDMMVNLNSTMQCPSNVPVLTVLEPGNVALAVERIFNII